MKKSNDNKSEKVNHHGENSQGVTNCGLKLESKLCEFSFARSVVRFVQGNYSILILKATTKETCNAHEIVAGTPSAFISM